MYSLTNLIFISSSPSTTPVIFKLRVHGPPIGPPIISDFIINHLPANKGTQPLR